MNHLTLPQYLIESSISLLILYAFYHVVLRKETFFQFNRVYLLLSATFAIVLPFIHITIAPQATTGTIQYDWLPVLDYAQQTHYSLVEAVDEPSRFVISLGDIIRIVYYLGAFIMGLKFLDALFRMFKLIQVGSKKKEGSETVVSGHIDIPASSFFSFIFWNKDHQSDPKVSQAIYEHELVHVRQWHSIDVIVMECLVIMKWFNPLIYLFRKHLRLTHEYIADQYVSDQIEDRIGYANILLTHSQEATQHPLSHTFYSSIRDRLKMLGHQGSSKWSLAKLTLLVPVVISLVALFAFDLSDEFDSYSQGVDEITQGYEMMEEQSVIDVSLDKNKDESSSSLTTINDYSEVFSWGGIIYMSNSKVSTTKNVPMAKTETLSMGHFLKSLEEIPRLSSSQQVTDVFTFDLRYTTINNESRIHNFRADSKFDFKLTDEVKPNSTVWIENISIYYLQGGSMTMSFSFKLDENSKFDGDVVFSDANGLDASFFGNDLSGILIVGEQEFNYKNFGIGHYITNAMRINKNDIAELLNDNEWKVEVDGDKEYLKDKESIINIMLTREVSTNLWDRKVEDFTHPAFSYDLPVGVKRETESDYNGLVINIVETMSYELENQKDRVTLHEWMETVDRGDMMRINIETKDGLKFRAQLRLSDGNDAYEPSFVLPKKFKGQKAKSSYQLLYKNEGPVTVKLDKSDLKNKNTIMAFSDTLKYKIIDIPNFETEYRIIDLANPMLQIPIDNLVRDTFLGELPIEILPLLEVGSSSDAELHWGNMVSKENMGNFSFNEFNRSRKSPLRLDNLEDEYKVIRFDIIMVDKEGSQKAFQSVSVRTFKLLEYLKTIKPETTVLFDNIIVQDIDENKFHLLKSFSFTFE